jgi:hypothetical protein
LAFEQNERGEKILNYIKENPNTIKADVIRFMKGDSATVTTHGIIQDYIEEGKVTMVKDKKNSQIHHLFINDKNDFNRIDLRLSRIETIIDTLRMPKNNIIQQYKPRVPDSPNDIKVPRRKTLMWELQLLLAQTSIGIKSESDVRKLTWRITRLMLKLFLRDLERLYKQQIGKDIPSGL